MSSRESTPGFPGDRPVPLVAVGVPSEDTYPAQVLDQLGICAKPVASLDHGRAEGLRVFWWHADLDAASVPGDRGGIAILTHRSRAGAQRSTGPAGERSYLFRLDSGPWAARSFHVDLPVGRCPGGHGTCVDRDGRPIPDSGIRVDEAPGRLVVSLPWDLAGYVTGEEWSPRPHPCDAAGRCFAELAPMLDAGALRRLLLEILASCFDRVGLPLVRVSHRYRERRHVAFRIDADGYSPSSARAGLRLSAATGLRFTWFLDMSGWGRAPESVAALRDQGQDVQLHCFRHHTYVSREVNRLNIRKGLRLLRASGVDATAIVSPCGYPFAGFADAIRDEGFAYSSEFGYGGNDLPSRPRNDPSRPLQIPVHPACSGVLRAAGLSVEEQFAHLLERARTVAAADGTCILYDHPIGGLESFEPHYVALFRRLREEGLDYLCMSDYARAWAGRPRNVRIRYAEGRIEVEGFADRGFRLEQVVSGGAGATGAGVRWMGSRLPTCGLPPVADEFPVPTRAALDLVEGLRRRGLAHERERGASPLEWRVAEILRAAGESRAFAPLAARLRGAGW